MRFFWKYLIAGFLLSSPLLAENGEILINDLKGVLLVPSKTFLKRQGVASMDGFRSVGIQIPGGEKRINDGLASEFIGKPLTKDSLKQLKEEIVQYWREQGYPLVVVEIPEQNIKSGVIQLIVIESQLGDLHVTGNKWFFDSFYKNKFSASQGQKIHTPTLLNDIAWLNRNPFQNASVVFSPGTRPDTTDATVVIQDTFPLRFYVGGDNTGNPSTKDTRLFAGVNWGYAFFLNQILSYQYSTAPNFSSFWAHTINYTMLFPWQHSMTLYGGASGNKPSFDDFEGTGRSYQASLRYEIPFKPFYKQFSQELTFGGDFKRTNNNINYVPEENLEVIANTVNLLQANLQYSCSRRWGKDHLNFMIEGFASPGQWLPDESNSSYSELSFKAKNAYFYSRTSLDYEHITPNKFSFLCFLRGQYSTTNLLPSEELGIGGYDTVRGYEERIINVDNGVIFNFEAKTPSFPVFIHGKKLKDELFFLLFFDYGGGCHTNSVPGQRSWLEIYSIGPGLRYRFQNYVSFRFDWGYQLKKDPFGGPKNKVHLGLLISY